MISSRHYKLKFALLWTKLEIFLFVTWSILVFSFNYSLPSYKLELPWLPLSVIGTAVAFFVGFKNNSAYQRLWEARKIWGAIVNDSRSFAIMVRDYISSEYTSDELSEEELDKKRSKIVKRHIAWLYQLKRQLRVFKEWEHAGSRNKNARARIIKDFPIEDQKIELTRYISNDEYSDYLGKANIATQIIATQSREFYHLKKENLIDEFRLIELENFLTRFYDSQGKCERIKNFPIPRQYASFCTNFVILFITLLPFGMIGLVDKLGGGGGAYISAAMLTILISWLYWSMDIIGDYIEHPFEGLASDIPMTNLTRTIERDLLEIVGEENIPEVITPIQGYLM